VTGSNIGSSNAWDRDNFDGSTSRIEGAMSHQVATRHYRAPELLFASRNYDYAVDMWSLAVVMFELLTLQTLFPGTNDIDQMFRVFQVMGSPIPDKWPVSLERVIYYVMMIVLYDDDSMMMIV